MSDQKIKPCPTCGNTELAICTYDSGWRYVECDRCHYYSGGEGTERQAIRAHNAHVARLAVESSSVKVD
jgi:hypothetical protein